MKHINGLEQQLKKITAEEEAMAGSAMGPLYDISTVPILLSEFFSGHFLRQFFAEQNRLQVEAVQAKLRFAKKMQNMDKFYVCLGSHCSS